jgi:peptidoglycan hydrolase CwlO-like protein
VAELTTDVGRLRDQASKSDELRRRLEESQIYGRQLELQCEKQATELGTRGGAMKKRIDELEQQIVELLSRAGNDHRRKQAADAHANAELDIHKRKIEIEYEQKLRVSEVHSKKEIRILEKEIERLRNEVVKRPPSLFHRFRAR